MRGLRLSTLCFTFSLAFAPGCGGGRNDTGDGTGITGGATAGGTGGTGGLTTGGDSGGTKFDVGNGGGSGGDDGGGGSCPPVTGDATLSGVVYAPNQELPVSGALVFAGSATPDPIPQTVYCAECVELPCGTAFTLTEPDGSFTLQVPSGTQWVGVQKGQFLRYQQIDVQPGDNPLGPDVTSLPAQNDPANNQYIPKIAIGYGSYDRLEDGLAKLGLGQLSGNGQTLQPGTQQFDVWDNAGGFGGGLADKGSLAQLLSNYALMEQYHIIFVPCSNDFALSALDNQATVDNVRKWVEAGGKLYVSDWSNEFIGRTFPQYQEFFEDQDPFGGIGDSPTDLGDSYDSAATVLDADLLAWLQALPANLKDINPLNGGGGHPTINNLPTIELVDNWSGVKATPPIMVPDGMGGMVNVGHYTWIEGPGDGYNIPGGTNWPMTITGEYGCGKLMFTTYHTAESGSYVGLTPQELVLMYLILEIGVCQTPYEPPPPQG